MDKEKLIKFVDLAVKDRISNKSIKEAFVKAFSPVDYELLTLRRSYINDILKNTMAKIDSLSVPETSRELYNNYIKDRGINLKTPARDTMKLVNRHKKLMQICEGFIFEGIDFSELPVFSASLQPELSFEDFKKKKLEKLISEKESIEEELQSIKNMLYVHANLVSVISMHLYKENIINDVTMLLTKAFRKDMRANKFKIDKITVDEKVAVHIYNDPDFCVNIDAITKISQFLTEKYGIESRFITLIRSSDSEKLSSKRDKDTENKSAKQLTTEETCEVASIRKMCSNLTLYVTNLLRKYGVEDTYISSIGTSYTNATYRITGSIRTDDIRVNEHLFDILKSNLKEMHKIKKLTIVIKIINN